jgi:hypothetical protein
MYIMFAKQWVLHPKQAFWQHTLCANASCLKRCNEQISATERTTAADAYHTKTSASYARAHHAAFHLFKVLRSTTIPSPAFLQTCLAGNLAGEPSVVLGHEIIAATSEGARAAAGSGVTQTADIRAAVSSTTSLFRPRECRRSERVGLPVHILCTANAAVC